MRRSRWALIAGFLSITVPVLIAVSVTTEVGGQPNHFVYLPAAVANSNLHLQQASTPTSVLTPTAPPPLATSTPAPTEPPGTPETPAATATPGVMAPAFQLAVGDVSDADVAGDATRTDCQHLVVWWGGASAWARFLKPTELGEPFLVSAEGGAASPPAVVYNARLGQWLVVWAGLDERGVSALRGRLIGCPAPEGPVIEVGRYELIEDQPAVAADGEGFAVVWRRSLPGRADRQLVGTRVTDGTVSGAHSIGEPGEIADPALDCEGTGPCLVAWAVGPDSFHQDVLARSWTPRSGSVGADILQIAVGEPDEFAPSVAWNASPDAMAYALAWSVESRYRAVNARALRGGVLGPAREVDMSLGGSYMPDIVPLGTGFVIAYVRRGPLPEWEVTLAVRMPLSSDTAALTRGPSTTVSTGTIWPWAPAIASQGDANVFVVWQDQPSRDYRQIVGRSASLPLPTP